MCSCFPHYVLLGCRSFPLACGLRRSGNLAPTSTAAVGWGPVASPATLPWHPHQLLSLLVSLSLSLAGLGQGPGPAALTWPGHGPSVGLRVHLCTWGVQGLQDVIVCVEVCS